MKTITGKIQPGEFASRVETFAKGRMKSPYAIVVTANEGYLPGLNILLNGLDYYGNYADVHIIYDGLEDYIRKAIGTFSFPIIPVDITALPGQSLKFSKYWYIPFIKQFYKVICPLGADTAVLDNIMKYFQIAKNSDILQVGQYPHTSITLENYKTMPPEQVITCYPLADFPIFANTQYHMDFFEYCWKIRPGENVDDPIKNKEMYVVNKAFYDTHKIDKILVLPGNLWISDGLICDTDLSVWNVGDRKFLYTSLRHRIKILHNKWWKEGVLAGEMERVKKCFASQPEKIARAEKNFEKMKEILRTLNEGHKIKISTGELN